MFRFDYRKEADRQRDRQLMSEVKFDKKPSFKELLTMMLSQYLLILPVLFIGIIVFILTAKVILFFWGS